MREFKGTPAPWKHDTNFEYYEKDSYSKIDAGLGYFDNINQEPTGFSITGFMSDADAKLIAAAPELLELAFRFKSDLLTKLHESPARDSRIAQIDEVIDKALGL